LPILAICFDLDGTLVETELLKARSYARAAAELRPGVVESDVVAAYEGLVGQSREHVIAELTRRFGLDRPARARLEATGGGGDGGTGATSAEELYGAMRLREYEAMLRDRDLVKGQEYPAATALLRRVKAMGFPTGLATMSYANQTAAVLDILGVRDLLDAVVTREEVARPKPDPEIYLLLARRLGVPPAQCLAIEDSLPGVQSALAAGMACVAATTALTRASVHAGAAALLPPERIVDDPARLAAVVLPLLRDGGGAAGAAAAVPNEKASDA
jgi:HAD superfamily hydrolase (TIGR01509 family)